MSGRPSNLNQFNKVLTPSEPAADVRNENIMMIIQLVFQTARLTGGQVLGNVCASGTNLDLNAFARAPSFLRHVPRDHAFAHFSESDILYTIYNTYFCKVRSILDI